MRAPGLSYRDPGRCAEVEGAKTRLRERLWQVWPLYSNPRSDTAAWCVFPCHIRDSRVPGLNLRGAMRQASVSADPESKLFASFLKRCRAK